MQQQPSTRRALIGLATALASLTASAQTAVAPPPQAVLNLAATAQVEVAKDVLSVVFSATREGPDAGVVQNALKQAIDTALTEARKIAKPGAVDVQTANFSLYPRYNSKGAINGWQGNAELVVEGRDMQAIAQLTGRLPTVTIARVGYTLSREAREKVEADVTAQAIARYRAKAADMAKQFGYGSFTIREVNVMTNEPNGGGPVPMMRAKAEMMADQALPVEPGKGTVSATVSGTVQMK
ncbi:SIMPL domain-containing protein [Ideonella sp. BN130291]|uniref:SIMPL domain-containing protein n=1 Tax=Ideonella sp. BN130291 TaxID=3112940 RepID=UPI002E2615F2|nr:SIMPL domain-containing protein [Ideonella sp. BN130291]MED5619159.1 SIMPL domain-containing protein [Ideonella sp. BN130291]